MIGLAASSLALSLVLALLLLLAARAAGWRRRRIGIMVRPTLLAILILLTIGLAVEMRDGIASVSTLGWVIGGSWLAASSAVHVVGRGCDNARRWGASIAHAGTAIAIGGVLISSLFTSSVQRSLAPGGSIHVAAWTIQLHDVWPAAGEGWAGVSAELRASSGDGVIVLEPNQHLHGDSQTADAARIREGGGLLVARMAPRDADGRWPIRIDWTPLLLITPVGLGIVAVGLVVAMIGPAVLRRRRIRHARLATAWWA